MDEKKCSPNIIQGVYTSVKKLLTGGAGYGYVARSETFCDIEKFTSKLVGYSLEEKLRKHLDGKNGERFILKPFDNSDKEYLSFTRVSESTSPANLGRSTVIAHHLVVGLKDIKIDASDLVAWAGGLPGYDSPFEFIKRWDKDPEELEQKTFCKEPNNSLSAEKLLKEMGVDDNQQKSLKDALLRVADRLFDLNGDKKTAIVIIPYHWQEHVPRLLAIILRLLPKGIQNSLVAVSQVWDTTSINFDAGLIFTYPNAPYLETTKLSHIKNKIELFDLTNLASVTGTVSEADYKEYADKEIWGKSDLKNFDLLWFFEYFDPKCLYKKQVLALKGSHDFLYSKNFDILENLKNIFEKLISLKNKNNLKYIKILLKLCVYKAVEKVGKYKDDKKRCETLFEIWDLVEQNNLKLNLDEMAGVLKTTYEAISNNYENILKNSLATLAKACINPNRNLKIIEIVKKKSGALDSLLEAIETAVSNKPGEYIEKVLPVVVSNWFDKLGTKIIMSAWDRINEGGRGEDYPCYFSIIIINKLILSSGTNSTIAIGKNNQHEALENSDSKSPLKIKNLDPDGLRTEAFNELKKAFTALDGKDRILENLKIFVEKLKVFENTDLRKGILKEQFDKAVKKLIENKERCEALFEIWDLIEENTSEPNEIDDALKVPLKAISDNYNDILKQALPALAKACINPNRNSKIIEIMKDKGYVPDPLLNAIEKEFLNRPKEIEEPFFDVVSNWFNLGPKIIFPAWDRIKIGVRENNLCGFSKAIVNLLVQNNYGLQIEHIDDDQQT